MSNFNITAEHFESKLVNNMVLVRLKCGALDIVTNPSMNEDFYDLRQSVNRSPEIRGYVEISDSELNLRDETKALVQFISQDDEEYRKNGRSYGYLHDIIVARFRNSIGRLLLTLVDYEKPSVAGLQGTITGEYLGLALAFDARFATAETVIDFNNVRVGLPGSPGLTHLMPRYIGISRAQSLIYRSETIDVHEAHAIGLISEIVDTHQELVDRCKKEILDISDTHQHLVKYHRQQILPSTKEISNALEQYYDCMAMSVPKIRESVKHIG